MINKLLNLIIIFFCISAVSFAKYSGGTGTESYPYLIATPDDLNSIGLDSNDWDKHFLLVNDINMADITGTQFNIIGNDSNAFTGVFDGNNHSIFNFNYQTNIYNSIGLFGCVNNVDAEIKNLTLIDPNVQGQAYAGSLVGILLTGTVANCGAEGVNIFGHDSVGGLTGGNSGFILNCYTTGSVNALTSYPGGLVGINYHSEPDYPGGFILNCYTICSVTGYQDSGGMVGWNWSGDISNSYASGFVTADSGAGGLVGYNTDGSYSKCFWDSDVNPDVNGIGNNTDPNVIGKPTNEMQMQSTFTDAGWDFVGETVNGPNDVWDICDGTNYPKLSWQIPLSGDFICPDGVDFIDYSFFANYWQDANCGDVNDCNGVDLDFSGAVDNNDLDIFKSYWLKY